MFFPQIFCERSESKCFLVGFHAFYWTIDQGINWKEVWKILIDELCKQRATQMFFFKTDFIYFFNSYIFFNIP